MLEIGSAALMLIRMEITMMQQLISIPAVLALESYNKVMEILVIKS
jgi:hypothetical protein